MAKTDKKVNRRVDVGLTRRNCSLCLRCGRGGQDVGDLLSHLRTFSKRCVPVRTSLSMRNNCGGVVPGVFSLSTVVRGDKSTRCKLLARLPRTRARTLVGLRIASPLLLAGRLLPGLVSGNDKGIVIVSSV